MCVCDLINYVFKPFLVMGRKKGIALPTRHGIFYGMFRACSIRSCSATQQPNPKNQEQGATFPKGIHG